MAHHPVILPFVQYFYAIGNTPAICLAQELSPDEPARGLLLGCGDPRNILFTLHTLRTAPGNVERSWDFTCCDREPAVIARNILMFTLIADGVSAQTIFPIFFHFKINPATCSQLLDQTKKLLRCSVDLASWKASPYGAILRFCTMDTLTEVRSLWSLWVETEHSTAKEKQQLEEKFDSASKYATRRGGTNLTACRAAGPLHRHSLLISPKQFENYWKTGRTPSRDVKAEAGKLCINPTFAFSFGGRDKINLHYGTDPLTCFHSATAFTPLKSSPPSPASKDVVLVAHEEFASWCHTFKSILQHSPEAITIRVFVGDALAFTRSLHHRLSTGSTLSGAYQGTWGFKRLVLDGGDYDLNVSNPAPLSFNIIDTSNLVDHVGLLNVLISALPLFSCAPTSSLYTEALLPGLKNPSVLLAERMCADITVMSLLLGIAPSAVASEFTSVSNIDEISKFNPPAGRAQIHHRIVWKFPHLGDTTALVQAQDNNRPLAFEPKQLARCLFQIYLRMFAQDDPTHNLRALNAHKAGNPSYRSGSLSAAHSNHVHYTRSTFAELLKIVKDRTSTDWTSTMHIFHDLVVRDHNLLMGLNNYQDLCCQLYLRDVYTIDTLDPSWPKVPTGRFKTWNTIPPVVCVVLIVPRERVKRMERLPPMDVGTPVVHSETRNSGGHAIFSEIQCAFGKVLISGGPSHPTAKIHEDFEAWSGNSDLIVSFWMPSWILVSDPGTEIAFSIRNTVHTIQLIPILGMNLSIFSAALSDENHVHILPNAPDYIGPSGLASSYSTTPSLNKPSNLGLVTVSLDEGCTKVATMTIRTNIVDEAAKQNLASGALVTSKQFSPASMQLSFPGFNQNVIFPFPIDGSTNRIRIARKSAYIETIVVPYRQGLAGGYTLLRFPVVSTPFRPAA